MKNTNWLAILASAAAGMGLGFLWYGALFMDLWTAGNGITMSEDETQMFKNGVEVPMSSTPMILNTIGMIVFALLLNWLITKTNHTTGSKGATMGAIVGLFAAINIFLSNVFAQNPTSLSWVDGSYIIVVLAVMGYILGAWRKK